MKGSSSSPISTKTNSTKDVTKGKVVTETTMIKGKVVVKPKATSDDRRKSTGFDGWAAVLRSQFQRAICICVTQRPSAARTDLKGLCLKLCA